MYIYIGDCSETLGRALERVLDAICWSARPSRTTCETEQVVSEQAMCCWETLDVPLPHHLRNRAISISPLPPVRGRPNFTV